MELATLTDVHPVALLVGFIALDGLIAAQGFYALRAHRNRARKATRRWPGSARPRR